MAYIAAERLSFVLPHLLGGLALDLGSRYNAIGLWFGGVGLYERSSSTYPPASYVLLWPLIGWTSLQMASAIWALICALSLAWLAILCVRHTVIASHSTRWFAAMTMLAITATSSVIWLGQLASLLIAAIIGATLLLHPADNREVGWKRELLAGALLVFALVKPSVTLPFLWMITWAPKGAPLRLRMAIGVLLGYGFLTLLALWFQRNGAQEVAIWAQTVGRNSEHLGEGYANVRAWLAEIGLKPLSHPVALIILLWLGWWTLRHRHLDRLLLLSITALVARLWTYHNLYDDLLLAIPMLLLLQIGANTPIRARAWQANGLLICLIAALLLPPDWMFERAPYDFIARTIFGWSLVGTLVFLLRLAQTGEFVAPETVPVSTPAKV